jgi:outer membrane protein assembly factor BamB
VKLRPAAAHAVASFTLVFATASYGSDWTQYNGPSGNRSTSEALPLAALQAKDPAVAWTVDTPTGFSSFTVADGKAYTLVRITDGDGLERETCIALDAGTGEQVWGTPLGVARYDGGGDSGTPDNKGGDGPRSTPSFSEGRVYTIDAQLSVYCLDAASGKELWTHDVIKKNDGENIRWKNAASPLVEEDLILLAGGGKGEAIIALDKVTGNRKWAKFDGKMTHATPVAATIGGTRQVIFFTQEGLLSVLPKNGQELWRYEFPFKVSTAASPVVFEDIVYCSAGYGVGAGAVRVSGSGTNFKTEEIWRTENDNINHWSTPVVHDGFLYGMFSFKAYGDGPLGCVDIRTGEQKWKQKGFGPGNVILSTASSTPIILALSDSGELVAAEARPDAYKELARAEVLDGKCWSSPVLADGAIYARSTSEGIKLPLK